MENDSIELKEGQIYPGWQQPFEESVLNIVSEGLHLLVSIPFPRKTDLQDFEKLNDYGIYYNEYPLILWKFGLNFILPIPLNPVYEYQRGSEEVDYFFSDYRTHFSRALIDNHGIVRRLRETELRPEFIKQLHFMWKDPKTDWYRYNDWLLSTFQIPNNRLWDKAMKFGHSSNY